MKHEVKLKPFTVPNFVRQDMDIGCRENGFKEAPAIPLSDLTEETLHEMCDQFRRDVFDKAGKELEK